MVFPLPLFLLLLLLLVVVVLLFADKEEESVVFLTTFLVVAFEFLPVLDKEKEEKSADFMTGEHLRLCRRRDALHWSECGLSEEEKDGGDDDACVALTCPVMR